MKSLKRVVEVQMMLEVIEILIISPQWPGPCKIFI